MISAHVKRISEKRSIALGSCIHGISKRNTSLTRLCSGVCFYASSTSLSNMPSDARRDARGSRDSEPTGNNTPRGHDKEKTSKTKTMNGTLDSWIEPSLAGKPSFEDHGGAPYGVLEHMQPLGEPPSTRVRARVKGEGVRKSMAGRSAAGTALEAQDTPEGTPGPLASSQAMADLPPLPPIPMDDEDDDDYAPGKKSKKKERAAKPRGSKRQSESAGPPAEAPPTGKGKGRGKKSAEKVVVKAVEPPAVEETPIVINHNKIYNAKKMKSVVEEAKHRAHDAGKPDLADAVEEVYQQSLKSARLTELLESILDQSASKEQYAEFQVHVKAAKKKLRAAKLEAERRKPAAATNGDKCPPLPTRPPVKIVQPVVLKDESPAIPSTEKSEVPKPKFSIKVRSPPKPDTGRRIPPVKTTSSSPVKQESEQRDGDLSDLSELTELSEGEEMAVDTPEERDQMSAGPSSNTNGIKTKDQAAERGSLGVQGTAQKRSSADADIYETEDDRILSAKKLKLSGKVTRDYDYQDSHMRSSLSGLPRTSRAPSAKNGAFAPAKITLHPNGGGNASARGSRAISVDIDSPLSSPAGSSRRSTPHVWKGPPKQIGKRAKTKTS